MRNEDLLPLLNDDEQFEVINAELHTTTSSFISSLSCGQLRKSTESTIESSFYMPTTSMLKFSAAPVTTTADIGMSTRIREIRSATDVKDMPCSTTSPYSTTATTTDRTWSPECVSQITHTVTRFPSDTPITFITPITTTTTTIGILIEATAIMSENHDAVASSVGDDIKILRASLCLCTDGIMKRALACIVISAMGLVLRRKLSFRNSSMRSFFLGMLTAAMILWILHCEIWYAMTWLDLTGIDPIEAFIAGKNIGAITINAVVDGLQLYEEIFRRRPILVVAAVSPSVAIILSASKPTFLLTFGAFETIIWGIGMATLETDHRLDSGWAIFGYSLGFLAVGGVMRAAFVWLDAKLPPHRKDGSHK